ncbi:thermophilic metalloprotease (M29) superfamily [Candidatus Roizmanbacteria bacterium CG11_big_fil_rev_8_21_14_0_20_36_8]|uniref:Thermophilic metalloprotease (M29) superfamily n=2 Tax=Candidatus Roizmaniibacteriota TaxID=1752723 RepID=A0A2M6IV63_9BACT|nr:MAG: thermophilic metalloprotease (M29) superfamily [Candidatus Roizmanbacteria bacterium CG11_big_fil_rev_8_21_14_0_20_36_8]PIZ64744.1 MAG: aminopeptidase [Candidatus Roizmanbacteria bacterium CG_4_10_14_0_2_um_filter_36_9]
MYIPPDSILKKYADVLIKFALWDGKGIRKGDVVSLEVPESAKPMLIPLQTAVLEAQGQPIIHYIPEGIKRAFYEVATAGQIAWKPKKYLLERIETIDHVVHIISTSDKFELKGTDSKKIMLDRATSKFAMKARDIKENAGKLTWTLGLFGTEAMAAEAGLSLEDYWNEIITACFLDFDDPIARWREVFDEIASTQEKLNLLEVEWLHIEGADVDLKIKIDKNRKWLGGSGRNIPSFEVFISPDWRGTTGKITFNQPLYHYGNLIEGITLTFKDGKVIKAYARENDDLLQEMLEVPGADSIGEFSLTDKRLSKINHFMAETLFDENMGGPFGNTHIALGKSYHDSFTGDPSIITDLQWEDMGFNDSALHTDIISTTDRIVTATLIDGSEVVIYRDGMFV